MRIAELESRKLEGWLPRRFPFVLVDKIIEMTDTKIVGLKNVSLNEFYFRGHFPEEPVMPGVLILEGFIQTAEVLLRKRVKDSAKNLAVLGSDRMRFKRPVYPGDQLILEAELAQWNGAQGRFNATAKVADQVVAAGDFSLALEETQIES